MSIENTTYEDVKRYYGQTIQTSRDLKTSACCSAQAPPLYIREALRRVDREVIEKFYGCGSPLPLALEGCTVLDLGCGTGRDVYVASQLVGEQGRVIGVDMTREQLEVARRHVDGHMERFGYSQANVDFRHGYMENLGEIDIEDGSIDIVLSNCVLNLSPDKRLVFGEILRVLKAGGELIFSDVFADRRIPAALQADPLLRGECLSGAMYLEDFRRLLRDLGVSDYRVIDRRAMTLDDAEVQAKIGMVGFSSLTIRLFKIDELEDICEDYGQTATYLGTLSQSPHRFILDDHHTFIRDKPMCVCGNTAAMLTQTRFAKHFRVEGNTGTHFGPFDCAPSAVAADPASPTGGCC